MRLYKNSYYNHEEGSQGYSFHSSKAKAKAAAAEFNRREKYNECDFIAEPIDVEPTRAGILAALNRHASHNDNG